MKEIFLPEPVELPLRKHALWVETCLEFFLAPKEEPRYWEVNLSPSGHWNVYRFEAYRKAMQEEASFTSLPFRVEHEEEWFRLDLEFDLGRIIPSQTPLEAGLCAVLELKSGELTYWALSHSGQKPDFHWRGDFIATL